MAQGANPERAVQARPLSAFDLLDAPPAPDLDVIVRQAAAAIGTSMAFVSLIGRDRQDCTAKLGVASVKPMIASAFYVHAVKSRRVLAVPDAVRDARFALDPLVIGPPHIRFFAGAPLRLDGTLIGALCVLDDQARRALSPLQERYLTYLADEAVAAAEARPRRW